MKRALAALILSALPLPALAGPPVIETGTVVRIEAVGRKDAFWRFREELVGQVCLVVDPGLVRQKKDYYSGALACPDDETYYFFQVAVERGDFGAELTAGLSAAKVPAPPEGVLAPAPEPSVPAPSPPAAWPVGARVRVRDLSVVDAKYGERATLVGKRCTVTYAALSPSGEGWFSGALTCDDGNPYFFYQVALDADGASTGAALPATPSRKADGRLQGEPVPAGRLVRVVAVGEADLYYVDRAALVGKACSVVEGPLVPTGEAWYAGRLFCGDGKNWQLYQVAVAPN